MDPQPQNLDQSSAARRRFLQKLGLLGVASATTTLGLMELTAAATTTTSVNAATPAVTNKQRWGLLIDTAKCSSGCDACVRGCNEEHGISNSGREEIDAQWIRKLDLKDNLTGRESSLPMMCQHCESAPCVDVCPTGASFKRADGIVLVNKHTCIGCRYCVMACPYKARSFIHEVISDQKSWAPRGKGTVESCTLCVHRVDAADNLQPACAEACTADGHDAILFGDLNNPESEIAERVSKNSTIQVRTDLELNTGVRYTGI